jgi:hypothetical protein
MRWTLRKCDALLGTILAAVAGVCFAQLPAFIQQYLQRLGGHVDEAQLNLSQITTGAGFRTLDAPAREILTVSLTQRVSSLETGEQAIASASASVRPFIFVRELDPDIAMATFRAFEPAVPLSTAGLIYGVAGMVAGWLLYELLKVPAGLAVRRRRDRRLAGRIEPSL